MVTSGASNWRWLIDTPQYQLCMVTIESYAFARDLYNDVSVYGLQLTSLVQSAVQHAQAVNY